MLLVGLNLYVRAYRRKAVVLFLSIRREQIPNSYHWDWPVPQALKVSIHVTALRALSTRTHVITTAVFMQWCICYPFLCTQLSSFLRNGVLPGKELPIVRDGPRPRAPAPSSGLDGGFLCGRCGGCICGWCGWLREACGRDRRGAAGYWRDVFCLEKCLLALLVWCHLRKKFKTQ